MIAIWYHCILSGGSIPIDTGYACHVIAQQMQALAESRLLVEADEVHIGVNGDDSDVQMVRLFMPRQSVQFIAHGIGSTTEITTLKLLREWLSNHSDWHVLYHHTKGASCPTELNEAWLDCMETACVRNWRRCVADLKRGSDVCGCHWLTPENHLGLVKSPFFGGNFWWAKAQYLLRLPPLPEPKWSNRYEAESWIGRAVPLPVVSDYHPAWPGLGCKP